MRHILTFTVALAIAIPVVSQDPFCETIVTQGKSSVKQTPEIITFFIEFRVEDGDYNACSSIALATIDSVKLRFRQNGIDEGLIKTSNYSISEMTERDNRTHRNIHLGYQARVPITIRTEVSDPYASKIFELIQSSFKSNVRINFQLSQNQIEEVKETLLALAVEDATSKAKILADNLNVDLGKVTKVQYGDPREVRNFTRSNYDLIEGRAVSLTGAVSRASITTLKPDEITMTTSVMLAWDIIY